MSDCFIQLQGGLGNQLFQIATAWAHAHRNNYRLRISLKTQGGRPTYWTSFLHKCKDYVGRPSGSGSVSATAWKEPRFSYTPIPAEARYLAGYFQSSRYFSEYRKELLELFDPSEEVKSYVTAKYGELIKEKEKITVLHIRRGDYVRLPNYHGILTSEYYARQVADASGPVLVFSDDIAWCRELAFLKNAIFIDEEDEAASLYLMSRFERFILSNSSFSWWAAWLADAKSVIVPDRWFGADGPLDDQDVYELNWIKKPLATSGLESP